MDDKKTKSGPTEVHNEPRDEASNEQVISIRRRVPRELRSGLARRSAQSSKEIPIASQIRWLNGFFMIGRLDFFLGLLIVIVTINVISRSVAALFGNEACGGLLVYCSAAWFGGFSGFSEHSITQDFD